MKQPRIRVLALAVVKHPDRAAILVSQGYDATRDEHFHRLLGGGVEFGERGEHAVRRELAEEIGIDVRIQRYAGAVENIFTYEGRPGHELALIYEAAFDDPALYAHERFEGIEQDPVHAIWHLLDGPGSETPVYPPTALELCGY